MFLKKTGRAFEDVLLRVSRALNLFGIWVLVAMMLLTISDVLLRYFFSRPILGGTEITEYLMVVLFVFTIAWSVMKGGQVRVEMITSHLPLKVMAIIDSLTSVFTLVIMVLIAWQSFLQARHIFSVDKVSQTLEIPAFPFHLMLAIGFAMVCLALLNQLAHDLGKAAKK